MENLCLSLFVSPRLANFDFQINKILLGSVYFGLTWWLCMVILPALLASRMSASYFTFLHYNVFYGFTTLTNPKQRNFVHNIWAPAFKFQPLSWNISFSIFSGIYQLTVFIANICLFQMKYIMFQNETLLFL